MGVGVGVGGATEGTSALITLGRQRRSEDLFVNAQSGRMFSEIDSAGSPGEPDGGPGAPGWKSAF